MAEQQTQKKRLDPDTNQLKVSKRKLLKENVFIAKIFLTKFEEIELHGLGIAISNAVDVAQNLQAQHLATITNINIFTYVPDEKEVQQQKQRENEEGSGDRKMVKIIVKVKRTPDFQSKVKNIQ